MRTANSLAILALVAAVALPSASAEALPKSLTVLTWEDYIAPSVLEQWEASTGIKVEQVFYDDESQRNLILSSASARQIDLAIVDRFSVKVLSQMEILYPVRSERNRPKFWPDSCGTYGRQYFWGTYGIVYRQDKVAAPVSSWKELFLPRDDFKGHIGMLGQADELVSAALLSLGLPHDTSDPRLLERAFNILKEQSHHVITYDYIYTYVANEPTQSDVWVAPAYSGDQYGLNEIQGIDSWQYVAPDDGVIVWVDCLVISSRSQHKAAAQQFIDFLSQKEISAQNSESLWVASPYIDVRDLQSEEIVSDETVYLSQEKLENYELFSDFEGVDILQRTRIKDALIRYHDTH